MKLCNQCEKRKSPLKFNKRTKAKDGLQSTCRTCAQERSTKWNSLNKDRHRANSRNWNKENLERKYSNDKKRKLRDPSVRIAQLLRTNLNCLLKGKAKTGFALTHLGCTVGELKTYLEKQFITGMSWDTYGTSWHLDHVISLSRFDLTNRFDLARAAHYTNLQPLPPQKNFEKAASIIVTPMSNVIPLITLEDRKFAAERIEQDFARYSPELREQVFKATLYKMYETKLALYGIDRASLQ